MSVLISEAINELQQETKTDGERIGEADFILAFKRANQYLNSTYKMPTAMKEYDLVLEPDVYEYDAPADFLGWADLYSSIGEDNLKTSHSTQDEFLHDFQGRKTAFRFNQETMKLLVKVPGLATATTYKLPYYSKYNVKAEDDSYKQHPDSISDTILCPSDADGAIIYKVLEILAVKPLEDNNLAQYAARELENYENVLRKKYPSQEKKSSSYYYRRFK